MIFVNAENLFAHLKIVAFILLFNVKEISFQAF